MRKKGLLLLAALLALCGCTAQSNITDVPRRTMLTVVLWDYDKTSYDWKLIRAFEDSHPDVRVEVVSYPDAYYDQKMQARLLSGRQTDVFLCRTMDSLYKLYEYGIAQPLDELLAQCGHDLRDSAELVQMQFDRHQYGIPYRRDRYVLLYNCELFDRAGIPYPKERLTWEQVHELAQQMQSSLSEGEYAMMSLPMDIQWLATGKNGGYDNAESMRQIIGWVQQMQQERCMPQYSTCIAQDIQQQCFELGQYGMYIGGTWYLNYLMTDYRAGRFNFRWGVTEAPAWEFIRFAAGAEGAKIMAAEQMMPAYLDSEVEEIYRNSFYGAYLDPMVYLDRETAVGAYRDTSREQEILCDAFRQSVTGQKDIDTALRNAQREIEALSS